MITSDTSSGFTPARFRTSLITAEHRSLTGTVDRAPLKDPVYKSVIIINKDQAFLYSYIII